MGQTRASRIRPKRWGALMRYLLMLVLVAFAGCSKSPKPGPRHVRPVGPQTLLLPPDGQAYTGAYIDFGDKEDNVTLDAIERFEQLVGKHQAIICSSSYWGEERFPAENVGLIWRHGGVPMILWSPWDKPYKEGVGPDRFSLTAIVEGKCDWYIDLWANGARSFGQPMFVALMNEMNGSWYPWSGVFYNPKEPGAPIVGPELFKAAYRHVVERVRQRGAKNVIWVFHANNTADPNVDWNQAKNYYPGPEYVDWLGVSVYGQQFTNGGWVGFGLAFDQPFREICSIDPSKPVMLAEWGIGEFPNDGQKSEWLDQAFARMQKEFPRLKAAVFWHERWRNPDMTFSNLRVNSSPQALEAYRRGVQQPCWLGYPLLKSRSL